MNGFFFFWLGVLLNVVFFVSIFKKNLSENTTSIHIFWSYSQFGPHILITVILVFGCVPIRASIALEACTRACHGLGIEPTRVTLTLAACLWGLALPM